MNRFVKEIEVEEEVVLAPKYVKPVALTNSQVAAYVCNAKQWCDDNNEELDESRLFRHIMRDNDGRLDATILHNQIRKIA